MRWFSILLLLFAITLPAAAQGNGNPVEVIRAEYGYGTDWIDVTDRVLSLVRGDTLYFRVNRNTLRLDSRSYAGVLQITVRRRNGRERRLTFRENETVRLRVTNTYGGGWHGSGPVRDGACFYRDGFDSARFCLEAGQSAASLPAGFNDQITSIQVFGDAEVLVFRDLNFGGARQSFTESVRDLRYVLGGRWSDQISSVRVERGYGRNDGPFGRGNNNSRDGACFYRDGFDSASFCVEAGQSLTVLPRGFDNQVTSIQIFGRAEVTAFRDMGFGGEQQVFRESVRDLRYVLGGRWSDQISSVRVERSYGGGYGRDDGGWYGRGDAPRVGACFYLDGFDSRRFCLEAGQSLASLPREFQRQITAIEVFGGAVVTAWEDPDFRGDRQTIDRDIPDLRYVLGGRWSDRIESVRVESRW